MDISESQATPAIREEELREQCVFLQKQVNILLFALLLVSGTVSVYLYMQDRWMSRDEQALKIPVIRMTNEFEKQRPAVVAFAAKLEEYGKSHPDFTPIVEKYGNLFKALNPPASASQPAQ